MSTEHILPLITAYLDGEVSRSERVVIERHIEECAQCRAELVRQTHTISELSHALNVKADAAVLPAEMWSRIEERLPKETSKRARRFRMVPQPRASHPVMPGSRWVGSVVFYAVIGMIVLALGVLVLSSGVSGIPGVTPTATETPVLPTETPTLLSATPTPTVDPLVTPTPTIDPLMNGGFLQNAADVSTLPTYQFEAPVSLGQPFESIPPCPEVASDKVVALADTIVTDLKLLCLYDIPEMPVDSRFEIRLTSPSGKQHSALFQIYTKNDELYFTRVDALTDDAETYGSIEQVGSRRSLWLDVIFQATQEYGIWQTEAITDTGVQFGVGSIQVSDITPIYSVIDPAIPLNPMAVWKIPNLGFYAGQHVLFAGRGLEPGRKIIIAVYAPPAEQIGADNITMVVPYYAAQLTVATDGTYQVEFVIGDHTPPTWFWPLIDPQPDQFVQRMQGFWLDPPPPNP